MRDEQAHQATRERYVRGPSYLVHAVLLHSKLAPVPVRGLGHGVLLLPLLAGVLRGHRLAQPVDAAPRTDRQLGDPY